MPPDFYRIFSSERTTDMSNLWNGFACEEFLFEEHNATIVFPKPGKANGWLAVKTEYRDAFPEAAEIDLLKNGFHLCFLQNDNRWGTNRDLDRKARFIRHLQNQYHLHSRCVPIGMSCGGLIAIKLAARYPELIQCLYLDAPVVNYMSCPCGFGIGNLLPNNPEEILKALDLKSLSELLAYRDMPLDHIPALVANQIPVVLVSGDSDSLVPFCENGIFVQKAYKDAGAEIEVYIKPGGDHHPHGLPENNTPVIDFILRHCNR